MIYFYLIPGALLSLSLFVYERTLIPIYGSVPTNLYLQHVLFVAITFAAFIRPRFKSEARKWFLSGTILALAPNLTYYLAVWSARQRDPVLGPVFVHAFAFAPVVYAYGIFAKEGMLSVWATIFVSFGLSKRFWNTVPQLRNVSDSDVYLIQALIAFIVGTLNLEFTSPAPSNSKAAKSSKSSSNSAYITQGTIIAALLVLPFSPLASFLRSPILKHPSPETYTHPSFPLQVHSSTESLTGLILVGEALKPANADPTDVKSIHSVRYLRAAHSLLGGVWTGKRVHTIDGYAPVKDAHGTRLGDSIYGVFTLQEASRLIDSVSKSEKKKGQKPRGLVIGLGTGISGTALHRHGYDLTVVEIDPAVHQAARRFFGFPDIGEENVFLEDAGGWVYSRAAKQAFQEDPTSQYDVIIHDCFSGGGVPAQLYTIEFWDSLKRLVKPDGVVVINYAGIADSEPARLVLKTLDEAFPQCRTFHDMTQAEKMTPEQYNEFINMVFFCTVAPDTPVTFRAPIMSDFLGSPLRRHMFTTLTEREVDLDVLRNSTKRLNEEGKETQVLSREFNPLNAIQNAQATKHWKLMRDVLPDIYWETF